MTKICSKCNKEYDDSYKFCEVCGTELSEQNNEEKKGNEFFGKVIDKGNELIEKNNAYNAEIKKKMLKKED